MSVPNWGTVAVAAEQLDVSTKTIRRLIARGEIGAQRIGTRMIRVDLNTLDQVGRPLQYTDGDAA